MRMWFCWEFSVFIIEVGEEFEWRVFVNYKNECLCGEINRIKTREARFRKKSLF